MDYENMMKLIEKESDRIATAINNAGIIRHISHIDADGLCSASIMAKLFIKYNKQFHLTIVPQVEASTIDDLEKENYNVFLFTDIGSGQLDQVKRLLKKGTVILFDHHAPEIELEHENLIHVNPHLIGIDGGSQISASTLNYLIADHFNVKDCEHLAIVGSIGDRQEVNGVLNGINRKVVEKGSEGIEVKKGIRIYGRFSKPIHKALAYASDILPWIGDEGTAIQFLSEIGINPKDGEEWRKLSDLTPEEEKHLTTSIIMKRIQTEGEPEQILNTIYEFKNERGQMQDASEFSTMMNSCGRLLKPSVAIMIGIGEKNESIQLSESLMAKYKRKLLKALNWVKANKESGMIHQTKKGFYIIAKNKIDDTMIGTICSILGSDKNFQKDIIMGFANSTNGVKVSGRITSDLDLNIGEAIEDASKRLDGIGGGHERAGGAKIPFDKEMQFITQFEEIINLIKGQKVGEM